MARVVASPQLVEHECRVTLTTMVNLTVSVDEDVLRRARVRALERRESVNAYLAEALRRYADTSTQTTVFANLAAIADALPAETNARGAQWTREDLHRA